jgi:DNA-binding PadR family transcriptional regulator
MEKQVVGGKVRKYYTITAAGAQVLAEARVKVRELVDEVLESPHTKHTKKES